MRITLCMLIALSASLVSMMSARGGDSWTGPYVDLRLSTKFAKYLERHDELMADVQDILSIKNETDKQNRTDAWNASLKDVQQLSKKPF